MDACPWPLRLALVTASAVVALGSLAATAPAQVPAPPAPTATKTVTAPTGTVTTTTVETVVGGDLPGNVFVADKPPGAAPDPQAAEEARAKATEAQKKAQRLQKLQQLNFDRRPSAILRAWSITDEAALQELKDARRKAEEAQAANAPPTPPGAVMPAPNAANAPNVAPDPFDDEIFLFRRHVTVGNWPLVAKFLADLPEAEAKVAYKQLITMLPNSVPGDNVAMMANNAPGNMMINNGAMPMVSARVARLANPVPFNPQMNQNGNPQYMEKTSLIARDVLALADAAPRGRDKDIINGLGQLLRLAIERGDSVENFAGLIQAERKQPPRDALSDREVAKLLLAAGAPSRIKAFLPDPERAEADNDREALNLLSQYYLAIHGEEKKAVHLEQAWRVTLAVLAVGEVSPEQKDEALKRAVELAPKIREDLGVRWLEDSFTKRPERGMEIIAAIGAASNRGLQLQFGNADGREKALELQKTAVEAMLRSPMARDLDPKAVGAAAAGWSRSLALLAGAWLAEAEFSQQFDTSTTLGPRMQRDIYGNFFYMNRSYAVGSCRVVRDPPMPPRSRWWVTTHPTKTGTA